MRWRHKFEDWWSFDYATRQDVLKLLKKYGRPGNLKDRQNNSPTMGELLDFAKKVGEKNVRYRGYVILPPRWDYRVTIDGIRVKKKYKRKIPKRWFETADDVWETRDYIVLWWD